MSNIFIISQKNLLEAAIRTPNEDRHTSDIILISRILGHKLTQSMNLIIVTYDTHFSVIKNRRTGTSLSLPIETLDEFLKEYLDT